VEHDVIAILVRPEPCQIDDAAGEVVSRQRPTFVDLLDSFLQLRVLPDGLFKGLSSLKYLSLLHVSFSTLPNLGDLKACVFVLLSGAANEPPSWDLDAQESESAFDGLVAVETAWVDEHALSRVPSMKNMKNLEELSLSRNKITDLGIGAFRVRSAGGQEGVRDRHRLLRPCYFPRATADWEVRHKQTLLGFARVIQT